MIIEIDTLVLEREKLTPTQFYVLQLLSETQTTSLQSWYDTLGFPTVVDQELKNLIDLEFLMSYNTSVNIDFTKLKILPKGIALLGMDRDWFQELVDRYPVKTIRSDGTKDYLRTDLTRCHRLYQKLTNGNLGKHEKIIDCLDYELRIRERENSLGYMKRLPKWLISEEWKAFEERMRDEESKDVEDHIYGTDLI